MGKQKRLIKELEHALAQMEADWRTEHENAGCLLRSLMRNMSERATERKRHEAIVDAMTNGMRRLTEERDAALADVETLTEANSKADATIGELRDDLADTRERLDAALTEAARMRKEWANDVSVAREVIQRKTDENIKLRRDAANTISELRGDLAEVRGDLERVTESWQHAEDLLQERERELDALRDQQAQQEHAEPVVTLQAIQELEDGERLIDDDGVIIECKHIGYGVYPKIGTPYFLPGPQTTLNLYEQLKAKTMQ